MTGFKPAYSHNISEIGWIKTMKLFLMVGIVVIHSNLGLNLPVESGAKIASDITSFISFCAGAAVPIFFVLSGFLFFRGVKCLTAEIYINKILHRTSTLLIPYLIWNGIAGVLFIIKTLLLGFDGYNIVKGSNIDWIAWMQGFWAMPGNNESFPFAFAFWFIRNLIIFVIFAPVARLLVVKWYIYASFMCLCIFFSSYIPYYLVGVQWFVTGAALAKTMSYIRYADRKMNTFVVEMAVFVWIIASAMVYFVQFDWIKGILSFIRCSAYAVCFWQLALRCSKWEDYPIMKNLINSVFWVYAFHQLFCTVTGKFCMVLTGTDGFIPVFLCYLLKFFILYGISYLTWRIAIKISPNIVRIATGGRGS